MSERPDHVYTHGARKLQLQNSPFFSPNQRTTRGKMCGRAGDPVPLPRGRAPRTSRLPRVVRWLGEKKGDCFAV